MNGLAKHNGFFGWERVWRICLTSGVDQETSPRFCGSRDSARNL